MDDRPHTHTHTCAHPHGAAGAAAAADAKFMGWRNVGAILHTHVYAETIGQPARSLEREEGRSVRLAGWLAGGPADKQRRRRASDPTA